jgi:DNA-binding MarR family transcriptional regulator
MKGFLNDLDKAFENRMRLGIMSALMANDQVEYKQLKELLEATDGNLASHIKALEKKDYLSVEKVFIDRKPNTKYRATQLGKMAFQKHLKALEKLISG